MFNSTALPSTSGEQTMPKKPLDAPNSALVLTLQIFLPVWKSRQCNDPSAPKLKTLPLRNRRRRTRAFVKTEVVAVTGGIVKAPERPAGAGLEAFDGFLVAVSMEQDQVATGNDRAAEAWPTFFRQRTGGPSLGHNSARSVPA